MCQLRAGFSRVDITPPLGIPVAGYFVPRFADGVLDPLNLRALALQVGEDKVVLLSAELVGLKMDLITEIRQMISNATGLPVEAIYIHCSHTHTGPVARTGLTSLSGDTAALQEKYIDQLFRKCVDATLLALADLKPAKMGYGVGQAPNVAFVRRFRMKDGSVRTNPGVNNPDIVAPIGDVDERVSVIRFDREQGDSLVLVNFANHPDVIGGCKISGDWPALLCDTVEKVLDNTKCIFFNGCQGDVNHVNVHPTGGYLNEMFMDFDDVARGYSHAKYIARVVTGGVLQAFDKVKYIEAGDLRYIQKTVQVPANLPNPSELAEAKRIHELHTTGRDAELPYTGMMLTTIVAQAARMVRLEHGPDFFPLPISAISIGNVALVGIGGEPFTGIGRALKETPGWEFVIPTCLTNGSQGYFPMMECYKEGGYEAGSSNFKAGVAEQIIQEGQALLTQLRKE